MIILALSTEIKFKISHHYNQIHTVTHLDLLVTSVGSNAWELPSQRHRHYDDSINCKFFS